MFPAVQGEVVNELIESEAIIFEMPKRMGIESEVEEKINVLFSINRKGEFGLISFWKIKVIIKNNTLTFL